MQITKDFYKQLIRSARLLTIYSGKIILPENKIKQYEINMSIDIKNQETKELNRT